MISARFIIWKFVFGNLGSRWLNPSRQRIDSDHGTIYNPGDFFPPNPNQGQIRERSFLIRKDWKPFPVGFSP